LNAALLTDDDVVVLDPAVEILTASSLADPLLCHTHLGVGMVAPRSKAIVEFVRSLAAAPVRVGSLREEYDDRDLVDALLSALLEHRFARVTSREVLDAEVAPRCRTVEIDLDAPASLERGRATWQGAPAAVDLLLRSSRLDGHEPVLAELVRLRRSGELRARHVVVRTADVRCNAATRTSLLQLGAAVEIEGVDWPVPAAPIQGLEELARALVAVHAVMRPDATLFDEHARARAIEWSTRSFITGLCLRLAPDALWGPADVTDAEMIRAFEAAETLEQGIGDVTVLDVPSDEVILGNAEPSPPPPNLPDRARRLRVAYLRWRIHKVKANETEMVWAQHPASEDKWIRVEEDLVPSHPELLGLVAGSKVADIAGGVGRVARRLAPAVGPDGVIVSIELRRMFVERARRFACEGNLTNLQFRTGMAQRIALPDRSVDAAINEWTGAIWRLGLGPAMVNEMVRIVRPGGRIAVTHRLVQLRFDSLTEPWVQYKDIYAWVRSAFDHPELDVVAERVWGQTIPSVTGEDPNNWFERYLPRLMSPRGETVQNPHAKTTADVYLTMVAQRRA
jgi:SAM-dependent methyltransferase